MQVNDESQADKYASIAENLKEAINAVLWNEELGSWFDYDLINGKLRTGFTPSTIIPIWAGIDESQKTAKRVVNYLLSAKILEYPGGIPSTLYTTGARRAYLDLHITIICTTLLTYKAIVYDII